MSETIENCKNPIGHIDTLKIRRFRHVLLTTVSHEVQVLKFQVLASSSLNFAHRYPDQQVFLHLQNIKNRF